MPKNRLLKNEYFWRREEIKPQKETRDQSDK